MHEFESLSSLEHFTFRHGELGWQWQETGADGWSPIYSTKQAAINAIKAEFATLVKCS